MIINYRLTKANLNQQNNFLLKLFEILVLQFLRSHTYFFIIHQILRVIKLEASFVAIGVLNK